MDTKLNDVRLLSLPTVVLFALALGMSPVAAAQTPGPTLNTLQADRVNLVRLAIEKYSSRVRGGDNCELECRGEAERALVEIREHDANFTRILAEARRAEKDPRALNAYLTELGRFNGALSNLLRRAQPMTGETMGAPVTSTLPNTGVIRGKVTVNGVVSPATRVTLTDPYGNEYSGPTDPRGEYVQSSLIPGLYEIVAEHPDQTGTKTGTLKARSTLTVSFNLTGTGKRK